MGTHPIFESDFDCLKELLYPMEAKRGRMDDRISDSESEDEDLDMDVSDLAGVAVNMELKGLSIEEVDYHGIKQLLMGLLPSSGINLAALSDDIIRNNFVGHVIKQVDEVNQFADDEDPVLSLTTMIPLNPQYTWLADMKKFVAKKVQANNDPLITAKFDNFFSNSARNAWFINVRFLNFPARAEGLVSLLGDLEEAEKKNHRTNWKFENIITVISRLHPKTESTERTEIEYRNQV